MRAGAWLTTAIRWTALALVLNLAWEAIHVRLYTLWDDSDRVRVWSSVLHCSLGDGLIALTGFIVTAALLRQPAWPNSWPRAGSAIVVVMTMAFTLYSEWRNVYGLGAWAYSPAMPQVAGIGLTSLLQWLIIPPAATALLSMLRREWNR